MNLSMHDQQIDRFQPEVGGRSIHATYGLTGRSFKIMPYLLFSATHHGSHDQFWILHMVDGVEEQRWNASTVHSITWA